MRSKAVTPKTENKHIQTVIALCQGMDMSAEDVKALCREYNIAYKDYKRLYSSTIKAK